MFAAIRRAFRPLDTTAADEAMDLAEKAHRQVQVRARALRMGVSCGDATALIAETGDQMLMGARRGLRTLYAISDDTPADMLALLGKL